MSAAPPAVRRCAARRSDGRSRRPRATPASRRRCGGGGGTPFPALRPTRHGNVAVRAPVRACGCGAGRRARCRCVAERATALKARVLHARALNSTDSLTASFANNMSAYSVNSVNKNLLTLRPFRPMPTVESDISRMRLCDLVRVHLASIEPGHCEFRTCCEGTKGDEIATELRTNLLRMNVNQSFINGDWVRPGLHDILDVRADACLPSLHPLCAKQQRVGRTSTSAH